MLCKDISIILTSPCETRYEAVWFPDLFYHLHRFLCNLSSYLYVWYVCFSLFTVLNSMVEGIIAGFSHRDKTAMPSAKFFSQIIKLA